jgi:hypothetical protein
VVVRDKGRELTPDFSRDPYEDTAAVDGQYLQIITIHGRDFQKYSIDNSIHLVPVDEVGKRTRVL